MNTISLNLGRLTRTAIGTALLAAFMAGTTTYAGECASAGVTSPCTITTTGTPELSLIDTGTSAPDWEIETVDSGVNLGRFQIGLLGGGSEPFKIFSGADVNNLVLTEMGNVALNATVTTNPTALGSNELEVGGNTGSSDTFAAIAVTPGLTGGTSGPSARFNVDTGFGAWQIGTKLSGTLYQQPVSGALNAPNNSLTISSAGNVGIGGIVQTDIMQDLHVGGGQVLLDPGGMSGDWVLNPGGTGLWFRNEDGTNTNPVKFNNNAPEDSLVVEGTTGDIGIGTDLPTTKLHILGIDEQGTSANTVGIRIQNQAITTDFRNMLTLVNNGDPRLVYVNTNSGASWSQNPIGSAFRITRNSSGVFEMSIFEGGNVTIGGILTQSSDKAGKENFKDLNADEVLQALVEMPITEWSYKSSPDERHVGPVAQDFYAAFGLGVDDKHLSPSDVASVSVLAIQAQQKTIESQTGTIDVLMRELADMKREMREFKAEVAKHQAQTAAANQASIEPALNTELASTSH